MLFEIKKSRCYVKHGSIRYQSKCLSRRYHKRNILQNLLTVQKNPTTVRVLSLKTNKLILIISVTKSMIDDIN